MDKKTIFLELPVNIIEELDKQNTFSDRSVFIAELLKNQLQISDSDINILQQNDDDVSKINHKTRLTELEEKIKNLASKSNRTDTHD